MITAVLLSVMMAARIGPMGPEAPSREPQMAALGEKVYLTYGAGNSVYFAVSPDSGKTFGEPIKVAETGILPLSRHRGPRIAVTGKTIVVSAVAGKTMAGGAHAHGLPSDGDLLVWRSEDDGRTWSKAIPINDVPGAPTEGLHSLSVDAKGNLFAAWLDKRSKGTRLFGARSTDHGASWSKNALIYESPDGSICECCHPSVAMTPDGEVLVMWRNWLGGSRDMYLTRSHDGEHFSAPQKLGEGTWPLNACPMDGGGLVVSGGKIVTAWRRNKAIYLSAPGGKETELGEGIDVSLAAGKDGAGREQVYALWTQSGEIRGAIAGKNEPISLQAKGTFPNVLALPGGGALGAWENEGRIEIRPLPLR